MSLTRTPPLGAALRAQAARYARCTSNSGLHGRPQRRDLAA